MNLKIIFVIASSTVNMSAFAITTTVATCLDVSDNTVHLVVDGAEGEVASAGMYEPNAPAPMPCPAPEPAPGPCNAQSTISFSDGPRSSAPKNTCKGRTDGSNKGCYGAPVTTHYTCTCGAGCKNKGKISEGNYVTSCTWPANNLGGACIPSTPEGFCPATCQ